MTTKTLHFFVVAGEASGDLLGARLMKALSSFNEGQVRFSGVGGPEMEQQGLSSLFPYSELSVMGLVEVLPSAARIVQRMRQVAAAIDDTAPDALITIDAPGFNFGVVKRLTQHDAPRIHYVAPTVWAWRPNRVHKFKRYFDHLLTLLPFEPPYFEAIGLPTTFVGHPVAESETNSDAKAFRARHQISDTTTILCLLPGSRRGEVGRLVGPFGDAAAKVAKSYPDLTITVPTVSQVADIVRARVSKWPHKTIVVETAAERQRAMAASDLALAASGTVALELAARGVPAVIGYRVAPVTAWLLRRLVRVRYANLVNILLHREAVPEHLQGACTPANLADSLLAILDDPQHRASIVDAQTAALSRLVGDQPPSDAAAATVMSVVEAWNPGARQTATR